MEDLLIRDEHVANQIGVIEEEEMLRSDLVVSNVAVVARHCDHHREWVARYFKKKLEWKPRLGAGRKSISGMCRPLEFRDPHGRSIRQSANLSICHRSRSDGRGVPNVNICGP